MHTYTLSNLLILLYCTPGRMLYHHGNTSPVSMDCCVSAYRSNTHATNLQTNPSLAMDLHLLLALCSGSNHVSPATALVHKRFTGLTAAACNLTASAQQLRCRPLRSAARAAAAECRLAARCSSASTRHHQPTNHCLACLLSGPCRCALHPPCRRRAAACLLAAPLHRAHRCTHQWLQAQQVGLVHQTALAGAHCRTCRTSQIGTACCHALAAFGAVPCHLPPRMRNCHALHCGSAMAWRDLHLVHACCFGWREWISQALPPLVLSPCCVPRQLQLQGRHLCSRAAQRARCCWCGQASASCQSGCALKHSCGPRLNASLSAAA